MASHATGDGGIPPRDAAERGLKRIMTLGGAYGTRNYTVKDLRDQKGKRVLVETLPFSPEEADAAEEAGIDTMKVRFDPKRPEPAAAIRQAAPNTFMAFSVPLLAAATEAEAVRLGYDAMAVGADAIMCQWSPRFIAAAAEAGVPVQGGTRVWCREGVRGPAGCGRSARPSTRRCGSTGRSRHWRTLGLTRSRSR